MNFAVQKEGCLLPTYDHAWKTSLCFRHHQNEQIWTWFNRESSFPLSGSQMRNHHFEPIQSRCFMKYLMLSNGLQMLCIVLVSFSLCRDCSRICSHRCDCLKLMEWPNWLLLFQYFLKQMKFNHPFSCL